MTFPFVLDVWVAANANYAELALTNHAMSHPFYLVNELFVAISYTALRVFVHILDSFYIFRVLLIIQIQKRKQNMQRHDIFTPLSGFAHYKAGWYFQRALPFVFGPATVEAW